MFFHLFFKMSYSHLPFCHIHTLKIFSLFSVYFLLLFVCLDSLLYLLLVLCLQVVSMWVWSVIRRIYLKHFCAHEIIIHRCRGGKTKHHLFSSEMECEKTVWTCCHSRTVTFYDVNILFYALFTLSPKERQKIRIYAFLGRMLQRWRIKFLHIQI